MNALTWNVVVVGRWNTAILTPSGIASRIFKLPIGTPVEVHVPMDGVAPPKVVYDGCTAIVSSERLILEPNESTSSNLVKAMGLAVNAIESLPETPLTAAGYNVRFSLEGECPNLLRLLSISLDAALSDADFRIKARIIRRTVEFENGVVNLELTQPQDGEILVGLNFHFASSDLKLLKDWLQVTSTELDKQISALVRPLGQVYGNVSDE